MSAAATSVLVPSYRRADTLRHCLESLGAQRTRPGEVIVVWQAEDVATRDAARQVAARAPFPLRVLHAPQAGVLPAENVALAAAQGDVVLLIDDDALAPPDWVARHLAHYADATVGAVGGPADNVRLDGAPYPRRTARRIGRLTWYGKTHGNMYDHPPEWRDRPPIPVDHLVGYNLSFRRAAVGAFEPRLRPYWQLFELDACLQVRRRGYRVLFDFGIVVQHRPTNPAYAGGRDGDLQVKIYNAAYNRALVLAKHSPLPLRAARLAYLLGVGSVGTPGALAFPLAVARFGRPLREVRILWQTWRHHVAGWATGRRATAEVP